MYRSSNSIKDKKFEVLYGLKFQMMCWMLLGHCYIQVASLGISKPELKQSVINNAFGMIVVSSDFPLGFFYFISAFLGITSMLRKFNNK